MKHKLLSLIVLILTGCFAPVDSPPPPTSIFTLPAESFFFTPTISPAIFPPDFLNDIPNYLASVTESSNPDLCRDTRALRLLVDLQTAIQTRDGGLFASLVNPTTGVGVRYIRSGKVITYFDNIKFIFETTYQADWGIGAGSGEPVKGSFQQIVLPSLDLVFDSNPMIACGELKAGGASYTPEWPYSDMGYYSLYFPGTGQYGGLDWETWAVGMVRQEGKPMLAALVHYTWEP